MQAKSLTLIIATKDNDEAMKKFYLETLGFTENEMGGVTGGGVNLFFDRHSEAAVKSKEPFRHMITLEVEDLQETLKELKAKGVKVVREPAQEEWGGWFATFEDPDGNYVQIFKMGESH